ncbi:MAG: 4Fe-4S binding protein [Clostridiales bacterium]|nr:4Fe-4S binding protein [Clostridiales bacterium]
MIRIPGKITGNAMKHMFKKPATIAYPKGELHITPKYRGKLVFDAENCIGCNLCMRDCPANALIIKNVGTKEEKVFTCTLNMAHCIFCGQCADSCRKNCISLSTDVELGSLSKHELQHTEL